ncbi:GDP-mannose 4,6-dehydratase [Nitrospina gracilis]|uniref:GDP-mannose 4,6-dehydratase n=1 Tax=Nitrospina gracilis TaxID=35801 RepID=UPI001F2B0981|nr:GDP-mannose 4,6-dehydratase [Nitrospina gracilis]MCF8719370.1 dTDP-D-glucose 4,6-dehydratase [Nitrospina gracilis Nb-211]
MKTYMVTGGVGFIGGNCALALMQQPDTRVVTLDTLTYAGNLNKVASVIDDSRHVFVHGAIRDRDLVNQVFAEHQPEAVLNFVAELHLDRSIDAPDDFIQTNVVGTFELLEATSTRAIDWDSTNREAL